MFYSRVDYSEWSPYPSSVRSGDPRRCFWDRQGVTRRVNSSRGCHSTAHSLSTSLHRFFKNTATGHRTEGVVRGCFFKMGLLDCFYNRSCPAVDQLPSERSLGTRFTVRVAGKICVNTVNVINCVTTQYSKRMFMGSMLHLSALWI